MIGEIETKSVVPAKIYTEAVHKYAERVLFHVQQACNGECSQKEQEKIEVIIGALFAAYELGMKDGVLRCCNRIKRILTVQGGGLD